MTSVIQLSSVGLVLYGILVLATCPLGSSSSSSPYTVKYSYANGNKHNLKLQCEGKNGIPVLTNTVFFRNGADPTTDECMNTTIYSDNSFKGFINLLARSECDGYYMCGVKSDNSKFILSGPMPIYAIPVEIGKGHVIVSVEEGESVTLPCEISHSPINDYTVSWHRHIHGVGGVTEINNPILTNDNSLVLKNVLYGVDHGVYHCQVVVNQPIQGTFISSINNGTTELKVYKKFFPPVFLNNLAFEMDEQGKAHFTVRATENEDYPVEYRWLVNDTLYNSFDEEITVPIDSFTGVTKVNVTIWNVRKSNGAQYSKEQLAFVYREQNHECDYQIKKVSFLSKYKNLFMLIIGVVLVTIILTVLVLCCCWFSYKRISKTRKLESKVETEEQKGAEEVISLDPLKNIFTSIIAFASSDVEQNKNGHVSLGVIITSIQWLVKDLQKEAKTPERKANLKSMLTEIENELDNLRDNKKHSVGRCQNPTCICPDNSNPINFDGRDIDNREKSVPESKLTTEHVACSEISLKLKELKETISDLQKMTEP